MRTLILISVYCCIAQIAAAQCTASITTVGNTTFCQGDFVMLIGSPGDTYQWLLGGAPISGATDDTLYVATAGNYSVEIDSSGCISTSPVEVITVNTAPPQPGPISGPDSTCVGVQQTFSFAPVPGATYYSWDGTSDNAGSGNYFPLFDTTLVPSITGYVAPGSFGSQQGYVKVRAGNSCGCSYPESLPIIVHGPPQIGGSNSNPDISDIQGRLCPGSTEKIFPVTHGYQFGYTAPWTSQWYLDNTPIPGATNSYLYVTHGGNYSVKLTTQLCGTFTVPKKVLQNLPNSITVTANGPLSFCTGNPTSLSVAFDMQGVNEPLNWTWWNPAYHYYPQNAASIIPDTTGAYFVVAKGTPHTVCQVMSNIVSVTMPPPLVVTQIDDTLFATPGYTLYQWFESGTPVPGADSQRHTLTYDGIYSVQAVYSNGCLEMSDTFDSDFILPPPGEEVEPLSEQVGLYPNPVVGVFKLVAQVPLQDKAATINITDATGRTLYEKTVDVVDGVVSEEIDMGKDIGSFCILKLQSQGSKQTTRFYKKQ